MGMLKSAIFDKIASRGPSAVAELLVSVNSEYCMQLCCYLIIIIIIDIVKSTCRCNCTLAQRGGTQPLHEVYTSHLNPENNGGIRNIPLPRDWATSVAIHSAAYCN